MNFIFLRSNERTHRIDPLHQNAEKCPNSMNTPTTRPKSGQLLYQCSNLFCGALIWENDLGIMPGVFNDADCCPHCDSLVHLFVEDMFYFIAQKEIPF